jgi:hypothetical protein
MSAALSRKRSQGGFRPFWPAASPPARAAQAAPLAQFAAAVRDSPPERQEAARHQLLWRLMGQYIPADAGAVQGSFVSALEYTIASTSTASRRTSRRRTPCATA